MARDQSWVGAERANADNRVRRVDDQVRDRREVEVHTDSSQLAADRGGHTPGQRDVVHGAECEVPRERAPIRGLEPRDVPALLVHGHEESRQRRGQLGHLLRIADVPREEHDPAVPTAPHPFRRGQAVEAREQARCRCGLEPALAHPRTAPAVNPKAILRWTATKKKTTGNAVSVAPAIRGPQAVPRSPVNEASQTVSVCLLGSWSST